MKQPGRSESHFEDRSTEVGSVPVAPTTVKPDVETGQVEVVHSEIKYEEVLPELPGYEVKSILGRGGMGVVYRARQVSLNRSVALKMILSGVGSSPETQKRFATEAAIVAKLQHPHIVQIYEYGTAHGQPYVALELVEGESLGQRIRGKPQPVKWSCKVMTKVARAMHAAHVQGIIHRDLKPSNILMSKDGEPKIGDFGLAKEINSEQGLTGSADVMGTPSYMAPEQAAGKAREITSSADVYALGAILFELLTGRPPFLGETPLQTMLQVLEKEPVSLRQLRPEIDINLSTICMKCLQKEPRKRYGSALELAEDLERYQSGQTILARPAGKIEKTWRWCRRNRPLAAALASLALVLLTAAVGMTILYLQTKRQANDLQSMNDFLVKDVIGQVNPYRGAGWNVSFEQVMDRSAKNLGTRFADRPELEAEIRTVLGDAYMVLERPAKAEPHWRRAVELYEQTVGKTDRRAILARCYLVRSLSEQGKKIEAYQEDQVLRPLIEKHLRADDPVVLDLERGKAIDLVMGNHEEGWAKLTGVLEKQRRVLGETHEETLNTMEEMAKLYDWALKDKPELAEQAQHFYQLCWEGRKRLFGENDPRSLSMEMYLALGTPGEQAEPLLTRAVARHREILGPTNSQTMIALDRQGGWYAIRGRYREAAAVYQELVDQLPRADLLDHRDAKLMDSRDNLAFVLLRQGRYQEAYPHLSNAWGQRLQLKVDKEPEALNTLSNLIFALLRLDRAGEALPLIADLYERQKGDGEEAARRRYCRFQGDALTRLGKYADAENLLREYQERAEKASPPVEADVANAQYLLGTLMIKLKKYEEAQKHLAKAYEKIAALVKVKTFDRWYQEEAARRLETLYREWGKAGEAQKWKEEAERLGK